MQKLVSFCMFVFVVPKHIAHEMAITSKMAITKNMKNCNILSPKTPILLTLNKGHPSSCTILST